MRASRLVAGATCLPASSGLAVLAVARGERHSWEALLSHVSTTRAGKHSSLSMWPPLLPYRERELAAVKVTKEDIDLIATEYEIDRKKAERRLRECKGDLRAALRSFLEV